MLELETRKYKNLTTDLEWPKGSGILHKIGDPLAMTIEQAAIYLTENVISECDDALPPDVARARVPRVPARPVVKIDIE